MPKKAAVNMEIVPEETGYTMTNFGWEHILMRTLDSIRIAALKINEPGGFYRYAMLIRTLARFLQGKIETGAWRWIDEYKAKKKVLDDERHAQLRQIGNKLQRYTEDETEMKRQMIEMDYSEKHFGIIMELLAYNDLLPEDAEILDM